VSDAKDQNKQTSPAAYRIPAQNVWAQAWKMAAAVGVVGLGAGAVGYTLDPRRFAFSYLMGFVTVLTMAFGSIFFVLIQHLTGAGWSVTVRRTSEFFAAGMVVVPLLALPNLLGLDKLYPWWHGEGEPVAHAQAEGRGAHTRLQVGHASEPEAGEAQEAGGPEQASEEKTLGKKLVYLNPSFFYGRALLYLLAWLWLADRLFRYSTAQDKTGDPKWTVKLQRFAPGAIWVFALSLTFAGFDWIMSLEPTWYSTMFGVRIFASSAVLGLALNILVGLGLRRSGVVKDEINVEHFHDLGKLMFGFLVFWAYISFSEFMLIWYAAIPEETVYYHMRWDFQWWRTISISLVCVKFIIPFFMVMSRNAKRNFGIIGLGAGWIAALHLVEMYYWIMPYYAGGEVPFSTTGFMTDLGCIFGCVGVYLAVVFRRMLNHPVIALRDPRIDRALELVNA
jgi:hypothetical protein